MISEIITTMLEAVVTMFGMLLITFVAMSPEKCEECIVKTLAYYISKIGEHDETE